MNVKNFIGNLACIFTVAFMVGCSAFNDDSDPYGVGEATKDISGVWKLLSVSRNDIDITNEMDFTQFTLNINPDGTYHITIIFHLWLRRMAVGVLTTPVIRFISRLWKTVQQTVLPLT